MIYLVLQLDNIVGSLLWISAFLGLITLVLVLFYCGHPVFAEDRKMVFGKWIKRLSITGVLLMLIVAFIPSTKNGIIMYNQEYEELVNWWEEEQ